MPLEASFLEEVPLMEFIYLVVTRTPGGVTVSDSGLLSCLVSVERYYSLCLLISLKVLKVDLNVSQLLKTVDCRFTTCLQTNITMENREHRHTYTQTYTRAHMHACT